MNCRAASTLFNNIRRRFSKALKYPNYKMEPIEPIIKKIDSHHFRELFTAELLTLNDIFREKGYDIRIAGGAVRDLLMGIKPADVDFASTATPCEMKRLFDSKHIRMLHMRGEEHGTITCRMNDKENFEITTLRVDVVCDGRRAKVEFTTDWQLDANRRDLTINSLFLKLDGTVIDYFGGIRDIEQRRVAFVGEPRQRIQEDYLRILRYFRFFGRIAASPEHEHDTIQAIIENKDGLAGVSAERIWTELKKIVVGRMAGDVMKAMLVDCGLNKFLGLPEKCNLERFKAVAERFGKEMQPITMIVCLLENEEEINAFHRITKLSNDERDTAEFVVKEREVALRNVMVDEWWTDKIMDLEIMPGHHSERERWRERVVELAKSVMAGEERIAKIRGFETKEFPVNGRTLIDYGIPRGPHVRNILAYLYRMWQKSRYEMPAEQLLLHSRDDGMPDVTKEKLQKRPRSRSR